MKAIERSVQQQQKSDVKQHEERRSSFFLTMFLFSAAGRYRGLWAAHASRVHGVMFVVDVTDRARIAVARDELHGVLQSRGTA